MNPLRRSLVAAATLAAMGLRAPAHAQAFQAGRNYDVLNPSLPVDAPAGKIEVLEFFWYGCIHCYNFEPTVNLWLKGAAPDIAFRQVPAIFNDRWKHDAQIYYSFEAMGALPKVHQPLFDAIHKSKLETTNRKAFDEFLGKQGVDLKKFEEAFKSFGVQSKMKRAYQTTRAYRVDGTPSLAVHGTYTITADQGGSAKGMFAVADYLADTIRKNKGGAKKS